ncbi:MAG: VanZ family protein [Candidatus Rokubacteria bacterium]|nr:VanZ family protein [Candidatus Rokubacteria bacterium]
MSLVSPGSLFRDWLPPLVWMVVVMILSGDRFSAAETGHVLVPLLSWLLPWASPATLEALHGVTRKLAHLVEYAVLAALWLRALRAGAGWPRVLDATGAVAAVVYRPRRASRST